VVSERKDFSFLHLPLSTYDLRLFSLVDDDSDAAFFQKNMETLERLQNWYAQQCNGVWEHEYGISIGNLDNPGWQVSIDLVQTKYENKEFQTVKIDRDENNWIVCRIEEKKFQGYGGKHSLDELLQVFLDWTEETY
jgi:hypothetical protein